jgi:hypothetical protein
LIPDTTLPTLSERELAQVAALWRRTSRELVTCFTGTSMNPTIASGSDVIVHCGTSVRPGDVVAYCHGEQLIVHRVVALTDDGEWLVARGDAAIIPDPVLVPLQVVAGTVVSVKRNGVFCDLGPAPRLTLVTSIIDALCRSLAGKKMLHRHVLQRFLRAIRLVHRLLTAGAASLQR